MRCAEKTATYRFARFVSYAYFKVFHRFRVRGLEHIPTSGLFFGIQSRQLSIRPLSRLPRNLHYFARSTSSRVLLASSSRL